MACLVNNMLNQYYPFFFLFNILSFHKTSHLINRNLLISILFLQITALSSRRRMQYSNSCFRNIIDNSVKDIMHMEELRQKANLPSCVLAGSGAPNLVACGEGSG